MRRMLLVYLAVGGMLGTLARYGLGGLVHHRAGTWLPWGTVAVNVLGCFLLGFAVELASVLSISPEVRGFFAVGFCGAFTTFSTYGFETIALLQDGAWARAGLYAGGSLAAGLVATGVGLAAASLLTRAGGRP